MLRESDADVETDSEAETGSDASSDAVAPPRGPSQAVARRKQIQSAPAQVSDLVPAKRSTPIKKQPKAAYDVDDSDVSEESAFSSQTTPFASTPIGSKTNPSLAKDLLLVSIFYKQLPSLPYCAQLVRDITQRSYQTKHLNQEILDLDRVPPDVATRAGEETWQIKLP
ncbi:hypothetical protein Micbo1qcDRAFT_200968 [Microdochium bolleyi]|uniref:Uncharacterized protein n=1 Tax=Microdochium bolleyi TaxID=196109 RepID=A0A136JEM6_9PEZI|nr:hypothetical protein Micbo1qcDRAFT_200968 [Microdochium bolleyi]